jgi:hypothetical protein
VHTDIEWRWRKDGGELVHTLGVLKNVNTKMDSNWCEIILDLYNG